MSGLLSNFEDFVVAQIPGDRLLRVHLLARITELFRACKRGAGLLRFAQLTVCLK
jgi:hypothetical protein